ncbi:MAG: hypothetical protein H0V29_07180 [Thermoleophilaceae bacterium]|nr:hypothetical protein [Thermoleophilaceae bacterium]
MPAIEGLSFQYALHERKPGRFPLRRWRYELWHGARLEAAGWRVSERDAARAVRLHASRVGHRLFGLTPRPAPDPRSVPAFRPGTAVQVRDGAVAFALVPLNLEPAAVPA